MTKISNQVVYIPDIEISGLDYFIGTDIDQGKRTVNFRMGDVGSHFNMVNGVRNFDYIFYEHQGVNPTPTDGYFYSNGNTQIPEDIEYFIFPKKTYRGKDSSQFFLSIATENPFDLIIAQKIDNNTVFFFRIDSIETFTNYFKLNVSEVFFPDGKSLDYVLSYAVFNLKSEGGPSVTKTSDLINDGSDGTSTYVEADELGAVATSNDYNDLYNLPTIPTVPNFADQTETNDGLVVDKTIAPNTLAGWWTYVKGLAQTFSERITFGKEIKLTPITTPTYEKGLVYFDDTNDCISFLDSISGTSVQVGYEVLMHARNNTGTTILNGSVVYISGAIGQNSTVALAQSNTLPTSEIIGIATHDIANNTVGKICVFGLVNDLNTSSFTDGQMLYLSATVAGGLTSTIPASPNFVVALGVVEHAHPTQGKILVKPQRALANNNSLGTSQSISATQNAIKTYIDSGLNAKLSNNISDYTTASLPLSDTDKFLVNQGGTFKEVAKSELGGTQIGDTYRNNFYVMSSMEQSGLLFDGITAINRFTEIGTRSFVNPTGTSRLLSLYFQNYLSATTSGANAGIKQINNADGCYRQGFDNYFIWGNNDANANCQTTVGHYYLLSATMPNTAISSFTGDFVGVGNDVGDTNLSFYTHRVSGSGQTASYTKITCGASFPAHDTSSAYLLRMEAPQTEVDANRFVKLTITNLITGATATHTFTYIETPVLDRAYATTVIRSNRNTGVATNIKFGKIQVIRKMF